MRERHLLSLLVVLREARLVLVRLIRPSAVGGAALAPRRRVVPHVDVPGRPGPDRAAQAARIGLTEQAVGEPVASEVAPVVRPRADQQLAQQLPDLLEDGAAEQRVVGVRADDQHLRRRHPTEDVLQPELQPSEQEALARQRREAVLAEVEAGEVQGAVRDEEVVRLVEVDVAAAVEAAQRQAVQLDVLDVDAVRLRRVRRVWQRPEGALQRAQQRRLADALLPHQHQLHRPVRHRVVLQRRQVGAHGARLLGEVGRDVLQRVAAEADAAQLVERRDRERQRRQLIVLHGELAQRRQQAHVGRQLQQTVVAHVDAGERRATHHARRQSLQLVPAGVQLHERVQRAQLGGQPPQPVVRDAQRGEPPAAGERRRQRLEPVVAQVEQLQLDESVERDAHQPARHEDEAAQPAVAGRVEHAQRRAEYRQRARARLTLEPLQVAQVEVAARAREEGVSDGHVDVLVEEHGQLLGVLRVRDQQLHHVRPLPTERVQLRAQGHLIHQVLFAAYGA